MPVPYKGQRVRLVTGFIKPAICRRSGTAGAYSDSSCAWTNTEFMNSEPEKFDIAIHTRTLEIIGFSISLVALVISLFIFSNYRSLRNSRTRIHKSLFYAMVLQVVIRLTIYIDQALIRYKIQDNPAYENVTVHGIDNMPYLCESSYILLEYAITVMFMWMFIEGIYLHSMVAGNSLRERISHVVYYATGWGLPIIITAAWATVTSIHYKSQSAEHCWYGYNFSPYYWIVESPRLAVIVINFLFLLNIIRVLVVKLSKNDTTEIVIVRKAVRAALVLLPLLGITNVLNMIEAPIDSEVWKFAVWIYTTHFLRSFQGFFISLIYCFLNGEVRMVIVKQYNNRKTIAENERRRRNRFLQDMSPQQQQRGRRRQREQLPSTFIPMTTLRRHRPHSASGADRCHIDTELGSSYL
ncbi:PDF receptor-like isoform X2 [Achroia grisella]|uniref:PDF receptor-like isoform X2 n=1 Tax=Achroia grisella TaxID=688607 RepID=UPI0027D234DF|nr:PDF receptor-like isoform X2 [Achroia grisella]